MLKEVNSRLLGSKGTCQKPFKISQEDTMRSRMLASRLMISSTVAPLWMAGIVLAFTERRSITMRYPPEGFGTTKQQLFHWLWLFSRIPIRTISLMCSRRNLIECSDNGNCLLNTGVESVNLMLWTYVSVFPRSNSCAPNAW